MDDVILLEHIHVQQQQDAFDDHEDEENWRDDSDHPEIVVLRQIEHCKAHAVWMKKNITVEQCTIVYQQTYAFKYHHA